MGVPLDFESDERETGGSKRPTQVTLHGHHPETGEEVGYLRYHVPRRKADKIYIDRLEVHPEHARNGYGSQLMDEMQRRHPGTPIDHGDRTDDGKNWWAGYTKGKSVSKGHTMATKTAASGWKFEHLPIELTGRAKLPGERLFGPTYGLDHRLFDGEKLRPEIRLAIIQKWADFCERHHLSLWHVWSKIVFFGSEASTWTSPTLEGNDDFDLSIGINYDVFRHNVESWNDLSDEEIATRMTEQMHVELNDPNTYFDMADGSRVGPMDETWFANLLGWDITQIRPYAAYDVVRAEWIVKPPSLPHWDITQFPEGHGLVKEIEGLIEMARGILAMPEPYRTQQGSALWDFIHINRSRAFGAQGEGWWDAFNVLEKAADQKGLMQKLFECHRRATEDPHTLDAPQHWSNDPTIV
jgi:GNAT superfamily N-acetyltransferase